MGTERAGTSRQGILFHCAPAHSLPGRPSCLQSSCTPIRVNPCARQNLQENTGSGPCRESPRAGCRACGGSGKPWQEAILSELPRIISQQSRNLHTRWFPHPFLSSWNQENERGKEYAGRLPEVEPRQSLSTRISVSGSLSRPCHPLLHTSLSLCDPYSCLVKKARKLRLLEGS